MQAIVRQHMHIVLWGQVFLGMIVTLCSMMALLNPKRKVDASEMNTMWICFIALSVSAIVDRICTLWLLNRKRARISTDSARMITRKRDG